MNTKTEQLQDLTNRYFQATGRKPSSAREVAAWALNNDLMKPSKKALIALCASEIARAMGHEFLTDPQGRVVRAKHAARMKREGKQMPLWDDIRWASPDFMGISFQQRRQQVANACVQLKLDVESYNVNRAPVPPVQMIFDFTMDIIELEAVRTGLRANERSAHWDPS